MYCPKCKSEKKIKSGKIKEKQRYQCKDCACNYTQSYRHGYDLQKKLMALKLYLEGNGFRGSGRILGVSNVTVLNWIRDFGKSVKEYVLKNMPNDIRDIDVVEMDVSGILQSKKTRSPRRGQALGLDCDRQI